MAKFKVRDKYIWQQQIVLKQGWIQNIVYGFRYRAKRRINNYTTVDDFKKQIIQDRYAIKLNLLTRKKISVNVKDIGNRGKCKTFNKIKGLRIFYVRLMQV